MPSKHTERLDVEDDDARHVRLSHLLQQTNSTASPSNNNNLPPGPSSFDFGVRETHPVDPPTHLLDRLQQFLPQLEAANADLERRMQSHPESVDIENLDNTGHEQYIQMNLGLGVFDMHRAASEAAETNSSSSSNSSDSSDDDASTSEEDSSDADAVIGGDHASTEANSDLSTHAISSISAQRPIKSLPKRSRPNIIVLGETNTAHSPPENAAD